MWSILMRKCAYSSHQSVIDWNSRQKKNKRRIATHSPRYFLPRYQRLFLIVKTAYFGELRLSNPFFGNLLLLNIFVTAVLFPITILHRILPPQSALPQRIGSRWESFQHVNIYLRCFYLCAESGFDRAEHLKCELVTNSSCVWNPNEAGNNQ